MGKKKTTHTADLYDKRNTRINTERSKNEKLNMDIKDKGDIHYCQQTFLSLFTDTIMYMYHTFSSGLKHFFFPLLVQVCPLKSRLISEYIRH